MSWIVLIDLRDNNGHVVALHDDNDNIAQFDDLFSAQRCADENPLARAYPSICVSLDTPEVEHL